GERMETREHRPAQAAGRRGSLNPAGGRPKVRANGKGAPGAAATSRERSHAKANGVPLSQASGAHIDERVLLSTLTRFRKGDFSARLPIEWTGLAGKIADTLNDVIELNQRMADELARLSRMVGKEGRSNQRAGLSGLQGSWAKSMDCVNSLIDDLVYPTSEMAR